MKPLASKPLDIVSRQDATRIEDVPDSVERS